MICHSQNIYIFYLSIFLPLFFVFLVLSSADLFSTKRTIVDVHFRKYGSANKEKLHQSSELGAQGLLNRDHSNIT